MGDRCKRVTVKPRTSNIAPQCCITSHFHAFVGLRPTVPHAQIQCALPNFSLTGTQRCNLIKLALAMFACACQLAPTAPSKTLLESAAPVPAHTSRSSHDVFRSAALLTASLGVAGHDAPRACLRPISQLRH